MRSTKDIVLRPISSVDAGRIIRSLHYSKKIVSSSTFHLGVFYRDRCGGALSFGSPMDKRKVLGLVSDTKWEGMIELNRMALADWLPKNSESRCLGISLRMIKRQYPNIEWVLSFSDGTQCGDGAIYRASGFVLTGIKENDSLLRLPSGEVVSCVTVRSNPKRFFCPLGEPPVAWLIRNGTKVLSGYQFRYIYFLNRSSASRLTVPIIPFTRIKDLGISMYRGKPCAKSSASGTPDNQSGGGGATPTLVL